MTIIRPPFPPKPFPTPGTTLNLKDRLTATRLDEVLDSKGARIREALLPEKEFTLKRGLDGRFRGPEGQPLVEVRRKDGTTAYVDPNTNQYWVAPKDDKVYIRQPQSVEVKGPYSLPAGAEFTNSHFSDADVRELNRITNAPRAPTLPPRWPPVFVKDGFG